MKQVIDGIRQIHARLRWMKPTFTVLSSKSEPMHWIDPSLYRFYSPDPDFAEILFIRGTLTPRLMNQLQTIYPRMPLGRRIVLLGREACSSTPFFPSRVELNASTGFKADAYVIEEFLTPSHYQKLIHDLSQKAVAPEPTPLKKGAVERTRLDSVDGIGVEHRLDGPIIQSSKFEIGFGHREVEKGLEGKTFQEVLSKLPHLDPWSGLDYGLCWILLFEKLGEIVVPLRATWIRSMLLETNRIRIHCFAILRILKICGDQTNIDLLRTIIHESEELLKSFSPRRIPQDIFTTGGVRCEFSLSTFRKIIEQVRIIESKLDSLTGTLKRTPDLEIASKKVGSISREDALELGLTGINLRASGVNWDLRNSDSLYQELQFFPHLGTRGDVFDRTWLRVLEMKQSCRLISRMADNIPFGRTVNKGDRVDNLPLEKAEGASFVESGLGQIGIYAKLQKNATPYRLRLISSGLMSIQACEVLSQRCTVAQASLIRASMNYSAAEVDR